MAIHDGLAVLAVLAVLAGQWRVRGVWNSELPDVVMPVEAGGGGGGGGDAGE